MPVTRSMSAPRSKKDISYLEFADYTQLPRLDVSELNTVRIDGKRLIKFSYPLLDACGTALAYCKFQNQSKTELIPLRFILQNWDICQAYRSFFNSWKEKVDPRTIQSIIDYCDAKCTIELPKNPFSIGCMVALGNATDEIIQNKGDIAKVMKVCTVKHCFKGELAEYSKVLIQHQFVCADLRKVEPHRTYTGQGWINPDDATIIAPNNWVTEMRKGELAAQLRLQMAKLENDRLKLKINAIHSVTKKSAREVFQKLAKDSFGQLGKVAKRVKSDVTAGAPIGPIRFKFELKPFISANTVGIVFNKNGQRLIADLSAENYAILSRVPLAGVRLINGTKFEMVESKLIYSFTAKRLTITADIQTTTAVGSVSRRQ